MVPLCRGHAQDLMVGVVNFRLPLNRLSLKSIFQNTIVEPSRGFSAFYEPGSLELNQFSGYMTVNGDGGKHGGDVLLVIEGEEECGVQLEITTVE